MTDRRQIDIGRRVVNTLMERPWPWATSQKGNPTTEANGFRLVIFPLRNTNTPKWAFMYLDLNAPDSKFKWGPHFESEDQAKRAALVHAFGGTMLVQENDRTAPVEQTPVTPHRRIVLDD